jgi:hypothetical protein
MRTVMRKPPTNPNDGYALRGGKFMKGPKALSVDPEILGLCLASGLSSGTLPIPARIGDRILRIATYVHALRLLEGNQKRRLPDGNE